MTKNEKNVEYNRLWRQRNPEKAKASKDRWMATQTKEQKQARNRRHATRWRDVHSKEWLAYASEYMKEYYKRNPEHQVAHAFRTYAGSVMTRYLKTGEYPTRTKRNTRHFNLQSIKNIILFYSQAHDENVLIPKSTAVNHIVSIPHCLRYLGIKNMKHISMDVWAAIWSAGNLQVVPKKINSSKRDFITDEVLKAASEMEQNHPCMKGLTEYLTGVKHE